MEENKEIDNFDLNNEDIVSQKSKTSEEPSLQNEPDNLPVSRPKDLITVRPVKFQEFDEAKIIPSIKKNLDILQDVIIHIKVEIGKTKSSIREVMDLVQGSVVELDKIAGEQVEVYANDKLVARGEVIVIEDKFGVRITTTSLPKEEDDED